MKRKLPTRTYYITHNDYLFRNTQAKDGWQILQVLIPIQYKRSIPSIHTRQHFKVTLWTHNGVGGCLLAWTW